MIVCASSRRSQESYFFFFNDTATTEIYTLSLHDALPISGDIIVMMDADGSHDPHEIPLFVDALMKGADFAKGSRFIHDGGSGDFTWVRRFGNNSINLLANACFNVQFTDLCYGYNAFWQRFLPYL